MIQSTYVHNLTSLATANPQINASRDSDHAPFKGDLYSICWEFI